MPKPTPKPEPKKESLWDKVKTGYGEARRQMDKMQKANLTGRQPEKGKRK